MALEARLEGARVPARQPRDVRRAQARARRAVRDPEALADRRQHRARRHARAAGAVRVRSERLARVRRPAARRVRRGAVAVRGAAGFAVRTRTSITSAVLARTALCAALAAAAACRAAGPDYEAPAQPLPARFSVESATAAAPERATSVHLDDWTRAFDDAVLDGLVARALGANLDFAQARERLRQARASARRSGIELLPRVDAGASAQHSYRSLNTAGIPGPRESDQFDVGFDASWELDLYGGVARSVEAGRAELEAAAADLGSVRASVVAEVARAYAELRGAQRRTAVGATALDAQLESASLVRSRVQAGVANDLDLARAEALAASTRARLPEYARDARERIDRIALLLGEPAGALRAELDAPAALVRAHAFPDLGLPAELLRQRPDLCAAERRLAAQTARIGVAQAGRYPRVALFGSLGLVSRELRDLPEGDSLAWAFGPSVTFPLFDGGRIDAAVELERARADELALAYRETVLTALKEVEDALSSLSAAQARANALEQAVEAQARAVELAGQLYDAGLSDYLAVLDAQRTLHDLQDQLVQARTQETVQVVAACKALGGGWQPPTSRES
ncbi:MAG: efflux transporter outer membrane subunit [Planctomycetota bacterium]|nr:MAG: efflux transporter outer membrane subunit [Planctomycetota bacterium]